MSIRDYLTDPDKRRAINSAIRGAFRKRCGREDPLQRILVIDDDRHSRQTLVHTLERADYRVLAAADLREAVELFRNVTIDLVITDIFMPDLEALETIAELRRTSPGVKIITISSRGGQSGYRAAARAFGAGCSLVKPLDRRRLLESIKKVLRG